MAEYTVCSVLCCVTSYETINIGCFSLIVNNWFCEDNGNKNDLINGLIEAEKIITT